jgi:23S rRNA C2498 (ribose-2'-O)-methylase RlmM
VGGRDIRCGSLSIGAVDLKTVHGVVLVWFAPIQHTSRSFWKESMENGVLYSSFLNHGEISSMNQTGFHFGERVGLI